MFLGWEALCSVVPDVYIGTSSAVTWFLSRSRSYALFHTDTMGYSFTYILFKLLAGCKVACYVHYPTISTDMLQLVEERRDIYNNRTTITRSPWKTRLKIWYDVLRRSLVSHPSLGLTVSLAVSQRYYRIFARIYGYMGSFTDLAMVIL